MAILTNEWRARMGDDAATDGRGRGDAVIVTARYVSPVGPMVLGALGGELLCMADWLTEPRHARVEARLRRSLGARLMAGECAALSRATEWLDGYFAGARVAHGLPLRLAGTPFQLRVWEALADIPYGATTTYGALARSLGCPKGVRAVAAAVGANPLSIFLPCHRVVGADGSLTGYAGGVGAKGALLALERR